MLRVTLQSPEQLVYSQADIPVPGRDEVLIRIRRFGICGSDIHAYYGKHPSVSCPIVLGHEFSGQVERTGPGVTGLLPGDAVTVRPQIVCGECYHCRHGNYNVCDHLKVIGCHSSGAAQEFLAVGTSVVVKLPGSVSLDHGAMVEPVAVGVGALRKLSAIRDRNILVLGAGTIGNLAAQSAMGLGAASVTITDVSDDKLALARQCGIGHTVNTAREDLKEALRGIWGADGTDAALECVGAEATANQAIAAARKCSEIVIVGVFSKWPVLDMLDIQEKELRVTGSLMYKSEDYDIAIDLISRSKLRLDPLISARFPLQEYDKAYKYIESHRATVAKVLIDVNG